MSVSTETIIFLHIPRTGGTTLDRIPERNYAGDQVLTFSGSGHRAEVELFAKLPESARAGYRFIKGHLYFGFHELVPGRSSYVTFLREPIARAVSFYCYARSHSDHYLHRRITDEGLELGNMIKREATHELFNLQTHMIAGEHPSSGNSPGRHLLERAKENLRTHFCLLGLTEKFDASLILLARRLGWRLPFHGRRNATPRKMRLATLDPKTEGLVREANALDLELYEFAQTIFYAQVEAAGSAFTSELRRFEELNSMGGYGYERCEDLVRNLKRIFWRREQLPFGAASKQSQADGSILAEGGAAPFIQNT
jgi:Galactose-3-O-sulfotransferase